MKECSGKKVLIVKLSQNDHLCPSRPKNDQVDSKIKDMGESNMIEEELTNHLYISYVIVIIVKPKSEVPKSKVPKS